MTDKSLGQIAYEAWCENQTTMLEFDAWGELWPDNQVGWQAAAEAVVDKDRRSFWRGASDAERAVLEAAVAFVLEMETTNGGHMGPLVAAIEALEKAEKP